MASTATPSVWHTADSADDVEASFNYDSGTRSPKASGKTAEAKRYEYMPLDAKVRHVRLLQTLRHRNGQEVECSLTIHELKDAPDYIALSYTWSRPDSSCWISIDGKRMAVGKNLLRFLFVAHTCQRYSGVLFWIDAICIDQSNTAERSDQVAFMPDIYKRAHKVIAWLGPAYDQSSIAMKALRKTPLHGEVSKIWKASLAALERLCYRRYWTRLWVLQELVLAKSVILQCGQEQVPIVKLAKLLRAVQSYPTRGNADESGLESLIRQCLKSPAWSMLGQLSDVSMKTSLRKQVRRASLLQCQEPRDRVYALLGITNARIIPDYNIPLADLVMAVMSAERGLRKVGPALFYGQITRICSILGGSAEDLILETSKRSELGITKKELRQYSIVLSNEDHETDDDMEDELHQSRVTSNYRPDKLNTDMESPHTLAGLWWAKMCGRQDVVDIWLEHVSREKRYELLLGRCYREHRVMYKLLYKVTMENETQSLQSTGSATERLLSVADENKQRSQLAERYCRALENGNQDLVRRDMQKLQRSQVTKEGNSQHDVPYPQYVDIFLNYLDPTAYTVAKSSNCDPPHRSSQTESDASAILAGFSMILSDRSRAAAMDEQNARERSLRSLRMKERRLFNKAGLSDSLTRGCLPIVKNGHCQETMACTMEILWAVHF